MTGWLKVVGLGPGHASLLTPQAAQALAQADVIVGYTLYVDLVPPELKAGKEIIATGMMGEMERCAAALACAQAGRNTAVVCSGDPGIYAMAGLVFELAEERAVSAGQALANGLPKASGLPKDSGLPKNRLHKSVPIQTGQLQAEQMQAARPPLSESKGQPADMPDIEIIAGVPALSAAAALLGAPLMHDFACISLSDLLTPWEVIEKRLACAAEGDFVIVLYNPKSKKRHWQLPRALEIVATHRTAETPVGIVRQAHRPEQAVLVTSLAECSPEDVDMLSILIIGNSSTRRMGRHMVTPRGYMTKYRHRE
ncbi:precorrin-3B C(17)-methyltransferase [Desulfovibrio psychrotolerans]|uniref:Precorrin-3B C(17)-methyltransferase n=1 Tax=Desulfovibrio psychrotolerans TaxID=415242 RepID=A0A7J0BRN6_9BACT|nr:precorrin-3B C(17)-methyltransferase [Desulfovibrio psychrotolerans]GFM36349.1 precorrin-3B C(17)-methyltransferase [Desulfovibrio psychrotolerans]